MDKVFIFDTTLRDGEQSPGVVLGPEEKLQIASALSRMNVDVIEAGFPVASPGDFEAVALIASQIDTKICALARAEEEDIRSAYKALSGEGRIHIFLSTSDIHIKHQLRSTREEVFRKARRAVALASSLGLEIEFSPMDVTRSDHDFSVDVCRVALEEGASVINIPDTVGYSTPEEYGDLVRFFHDELKGAFLSVHTHNDLGLAVANAFAGIESGARQVEGSMNGIGERAGNCATEEIVMLLKTRSKNFFTEINTQEIARTSRLVSRLTGYQVPPNKAIVGRNAFAHESGIHQDGVLKDPSTYEIMDPRDVGLESNRLVLGKHSGRHAFREEIESRGYRLSDSALNKAFRLFKEIADKREQVSDADIEALVTDASRGDTRVFELVYFEASTGSTVRPKATAVLLHPDGTEHYGEAEGDGPIDALFAALQKASLRDVEVLDFRVDAVDGGSDALGEVRVFLKDGGIEKNASSNSTDIIEAAARAWIRALSR